MGRNFRTTLVMYGHDILSFVMYIHDIDYRCKMTTYSLSATANAIFFDILACS